MKWRKNGTNIFEFPYRLVVRELLENIVSLLVFFRSCIFHRVIYAKIKWGFFLFDFQMKKIYIDYFFVNFKGKKCFSVTDTEEMWS